VVSAAKQQKQKVVDFQTAHGGTQMSTTHSCLKTYCVRDRLGEIRPIVVKAYVVPGLKHDLLSVKGLNQSGYRVIHDEDEEYLLSSTRRLINPNHSHL
jgi:hypothetical protein